MLQLQPGIFPSIIQAPTQCYPFLPHSEPPPDCVHGVETNVLTMSGDAGRFLARMAQVSGRGGV